MVKTFALVALLFFVNPSRAGIYLTKGPIPEARLSAEYPMISTSADTQEGVTYARQFNHGFTATGALGVVFYGIYLGVAYEHWFSGRATDGQTDWLQYQLGGGEIGFRIETNPRIYWQITASAFYPLTAFMKSSAGTFTSANPGLSYQARLALGLRLNRFQSMEMNCGYRMANLGDLTDNGTSFLGGEAFNLTSFLFGLVFAFHM